MSDKKRFLVIVDPWKELMPDDVDNFPHLAPDVAIQCQLIYNQLSRLEPLFDEIIVMSSRREINPIFDELYNVTGDSYEYLLDKQDWDMWLCGFHYGRCIHHKIQEVIDQNEWNNDRFHIIRNLSFGFPGDSKAHEYYSRKPIARPKETPGIEVYRHEHLVRNTKEYQWDYIDRFTEF